MTNVHVVAWEFDGGGGFDWYHDPAPADLEFGAEIRNCEEFKDQHWTAYRFDVEVESKETATEEIDANLIYLCSEAEMFYSASGKRYRPPLTNTNCLEGMQCPKCGAEEPFHIEVIKIATVWDSGTEDLGGDTEWQDDSFCQCTACGHAATVADFKVA